MNEHREALKGYLSRTAREPDLVPGMIRKLEPFFERAERGRYALSSANDVGLNEIAAAVENSAGRRLSNVTFVRIGRIGHVTANDEALIWKKLMEERGDTVADCLRAEHRTSLQHDLEAAGSSAQRLQEQIETDLLRHLDAPIAKMLGEAAGAAVRQAVGDLLSTAILFGIGFGLAAKLERAARTAALLDLLPRVIPLHALRQDPQHFKVLAN
jgi:class 3 adenylate cyclase